MVDWWSKEISSWFSIPSSEFDVNSKFKLNFGLNIHNDIYNTNYFFDDLILNNLIFDDLKTINVNDEEKKLLIILINN